MPIGPPDPASTMSVRLQVVQAFEALLNGETLRPAVAYRSRTEALESANLPSYLIRLKEDSRTRESATISLSRVTIRVECYTAGEAPQDDALDPLLVYAVQKFYEDNTPFSALVIGGADPEIVFDVENGYEDLAMAAVEFTVVFKSTTSDPTVKR